MRKILISVLLTMVLAACNVPVAQPSAPVPETVVFSYTVKGYCLISSQNGCELEVNDLSVSAPIPFRLTVGDLWHPTMKSSQGIYFSESKGATGVGMKVIAQCGDKEVSVPLPHWAKVGESFTYEVELSCSK